MPQTSGGRPEKNFSNLTGNADHPLEALLQMSARYVAEHAGAHLQIANYGAS